MISRDSIQTLLECAPHVTHKLVVIFSKPVGLDPRNCKITLPLVILDAPDRDRCPYIGDEAVSGLTLFV